MPVVGLLRVSIRQSSVTAAPTPAIPDPETEHVVRVIVARCARPNPGPSYLEIELESDDEMESEDRHIIIYDKIKT